ncbi:MAG: chemotaxis response regulator protein-glutamate methylesterase [Pontiellaceae bacterium]|nr:chemotaxis response regulator protein-glutamate methylesterase [Pontiellaceae bacterium]MBN2785808.1 chemotaxis response regulator protein-glutamate methylesterase [Pontiellaceae bacterium]
MPILSNNPKSSNRASDIKVLVVDDNAVFRKLLEKELNAAEGITVVGTATDPYDAREKIIQLKPDALTLDIVMPRMSGLDFLRKLMASHPMPVIIVSAWGKQDSPIMLEALSEGAIAVLQKPGFQKRSRDMSAELADLLRRAPNRTAMLNSENKRAKSALNTQSRTRSAPAGKNLIAIGASTGGVRTLEHIFKQLPSHTPGIVVVQHMPAQFTGPFAERLDTLCRMKVKEAEHLDSVKTGCILIAPGGRHMTIARNRDGSYHVLLNDDPKVCQQRPSVDVLFHSVAKHAESRAVGVILTGMGNDGAAGLLAMRNAGAQTIAEDEQSCVVYGMPMEAVKCGAAEHIVSLDAMAGQLLECAYRNPAHSGVMG